MDRDGSSSNKQRKKIVSSHIEYGRHLLAYRSRPAHIQETVVVLVSHHRLAYTSGNVLRGSYLPVGMNHFTIVKRLKN